MSIDFHCEHCNKLIKAPDEAGGQNGKCPHCKAVNYIPRPQSLVEELPLVPLDEAEERRRQRAADQDMAIQRNLLQDKARPDDRGKRSALRRESGTPTPQQGSASMSSKQMTSLVVSFIEAMSSGTLEKASKIAAQLQDHRKATGRILDDLMTDDLSAYGLPSIPRPVLLGFLKQLRQQLRL